MFERLLERLASALDSADIPYMALPCADPATGIRGDLIFSFSPYKQQALGRVRTVKLGAAEVRFASGEDLLIHNV